jgi:hypothetical protein
MAQLAAGRSSGDALRPDAARPRRDVQTVGAARRRACPPIAPSLALARATPRPYVQMLRQAATGRCFTGVNDDAHGGGGLPAVGAGRPPSGRGTSEGTDRAWRRRAHTRAAGPTMRDDGRDDSQWSCAGRIEARAVKQHAAKAAGQRARARQGSREDPPGARARRLGPRRAPGGPAPGTRRREGSAWRTRQVSRPRRQGPEREPTDRMMTSERAIVLPLTDRAGDPDRPMTGRRGV